MPSEPQNDDSQVKSFSPGALLASIQSGESRLLAEGAEGYSYFRHGPSNLVFGAPFPSNRSLSDYYDGFLFQRPESETFERMRQEVDAATAEITRCLVKEYHARTESLLDFGGGLGFYAAGFAREFGRVTLYEVDPQACQYARAAFPGAFDVLQGSPGDPVPTSDRFDLVFASHVIEHYVDLPRFFETLRRVTRPGGLVVVATPNSASWEYVGRPLLIAHYVRKVSGASLRNVPSALAKFLRDPWIFCDPPRHIYAFDSKSLAMVAAESGLAVESCFTEYAYRAHFARTRAVAGTGWGGAKRAAWTVLNSMADPISRAFAAFDPAERRGVNLVMVARVPR